MNVVGIIAEYNPFHKGHAYHIQKARELTGADYCIVIMSPDFVQRGEPAIMGKYSRAEMALMNGADCVLELPVAYATGAARTFAEGAVALLDKLGVVTHLCFGSEAGSLTDLSQIADILSEEPECYSAAFKDFLKSGCSYPTARQRALETILEEETASCLNTPNNVLAIEYLLALRRRHSRITPVTIPRKGDYHGLEMQGMTTSASAIRHCFLQAVEDPQVFFSLRNAVPENTFALFEKNHQNNMPIFPDDLSDMLNYRLLSLTDSSLEEFEDVSEELANLIHAKVDSLSTFSALGDQCKSKQYTRTRINRALLHILLDIKKEDLREAQANDYGNFVRVLGFRSAFSPCLTLIKKQGALSLLTKTADAQEKLSPADFKCFRQTVFSSDLYRSLISSRYHLQPKNEYTQGLILLP